MEKTMEILVEKILDYKEELEERELAEEKYEVSREEFTYLLGGIPSFRVVPGISAHMGFEELYHCENEADAALVKKHMKDLFDIEDMDSLLKACYTRYAGSDEYEQFMTFWKNAPMFDISELNEDGLRGFTMCMGIAANFYPILGEKGLYAWDISERINLCRLAVAGGIISDEEFAEATEPWVRMAQVFYHSYEEYAISCLCGAMYQFATEGDDDLEGFLDLNIKILNVLFGEEGPWSTSEWYVPKEREIAGLVRENLGCIISKRALENESINYMYREEPIEDCPDSGWRFMYGDEDHEYLEEDDNSKIIYINTICNLQPDILAYIHANVGSSFKMTEDGWVQIKGSNMEVSEDDEDDMEDDDMMEEAETFTIDRIDYYYDKAFEVYCDMHNIEPEDVTKEQLQEIYLYAGNHIGFFVTWLIKHDFIGDEHKDCEGVQKVKDETMTGTEFLIEYCDTKLWSDDVAESLIPFVKEYYEDNYFNDYVEWVIEELCDLPMEFIGTWEDYHKFEHVLDEAYEEFCGE